MKLYYINTAKLSLYWTEILKGAQEPIISTLVLTVALLYTYIWLYTWL